MSEGARIVGYWTLGTVAIASGTALTGGSAFESIGLLVVLSFPVAFAPVFFGWLLVAVGSAVWGVNLDV
jgi:hypothetical protein